VLGIGHLKLAHCREDIHHHPLCPLGSPSSWLQGSKGLAVLQATTALGGLCTPVLSLLVTAATAGPLQGGKVGITVTSEWAEPYSSSADGKRRSGREVAGSG
jgi:hypothetical protein